MMLAVLVLTPAMANAGIIITNFKDAETTSLPNVLNQSQRMARDNHHQNRWYHHHQSNGIIITNVVETRLTAGSSSLIVSRTSIPHREPVERSMGFYFI